MAEGIQTLESSVLLSTTRFGPHPYLLFRRHFPIPRPHPTCPTPPTLGMTTSNHEHPYTPPPADGVAVGDALSGSALVVLEASGAPRCLRPRPVAGAAEGGAAAVGGAVAGAAAAGAKAGTAPLLPGLPLLAAEPSGTGAAAAAEGGAAAASTAAAREAVERDVEAHVAREYGDLLSGESSGGAD